MSEPWPVDQERRYTLDELRRDASKGVSAFTLIVAYAWLCVLFFSGNGFSLQMLSPALLSLVTTASLLVGGWRPRLAATLYVAGLAATCVVDTWLHGIVRAIYLTIPSVALMAVWLNPLALLLATGLVVGGMVAVAVGLTDRAVWSPSMVYPLIVLAVTGVASWLSSRSIYTVLNWAWQSYLQLRQEIERRRDRQGKLNQALKAMDEASYRLQRMNYELARARDDAEELRRVKQQFVTNISHELRTPLSLIAGFAEMMYLAPESYGPALPREYMGDVREIYRASQHLLGLIDDILDLSRINVGKLLLTRRDVDITETVREAVGTIRPLIEAKGLALEVDIPDRSPNVFADPTRVRQVLLNLLNNARRFTDHGSVRVHLDATDGELRIAVSDTGVGIAPSEHAKLFEEFRQLDGSLAREHDGTGLGLAISKEFVELHGGHISVQSTGIPGKGSTFTFTLPLSESQGQESLVGATVRTSARPATEPVPTLLFVSRDASIVHLAERHLGAEYRVVGTQDVDKLPALVEQHAPLAVLVSPAQYEEPELLKRAQASLGDRDVPVLVCPLGGEDRLAQALGVQAYLVKPIRREVFLQTLGTLGEDVRRLLIVDDDVRLQRLLTRMIAAAPRPYEVVRAYDGAEGLARLREGGADAIVLDLLMPTVDGETFLERMRQEPSLHDIPVMVVSAKGYDVEDCEFLGGGSVGLAFRRGLANEDAINYAKALLLALRGARSAA